MLLQTIRGNYEGFTKREVKKAREARRLQGMLGYPSERDFKQMAKEKERVSTSIPRKSNVSSKDVANAKAIFGPSTPRLKGTSVREKPIRAETEYVEIPLEVVEIN